MNPADNQNNSSFPPPAQPETGFTTNPSVSQPSGFPAQTDYQPSTFSPSVGSPTDTGAPNTGMPAVNTIPQSQAPQSTLDPASPLPNTGGSQPQSQPEVVTTTSSSGGNSNKKKVLAALAIIVMVFGIGAGVYAFRNYQAGSTSAWDCSLYISALQSDGSLVVTNGSDRDEPADVARISINGLEVATVNVPALAAGEGTTLQTGVSLPINESYTWRVQIAECVNTGSNEISVVTAECSDVIAYDENWQTIPSSALTSLEEGDVVRFAVSGIATSGSFDMARFRVNGAAAVEVTDKKPGSEEFYYEYTIPADEYTFSVTAEIHHTTLGWF